MTTQATDIGDATVDSIAGSFEVVNTTEDGSAVGIEAIAMLVERRMGVEWQPFEAECATDPTAPLVVEVEQVFTFECELADGQSAGTELRVVADAQIFGLDEPYRQVIELP